MAELVRISHVALQLEPGGMERLLVEFARHADRRQFDVQFVTVGSRGPIAAELEAAGCRVTVLNARPGVRPSLVLRLAKLFRDQHIDVVHTHNTKPLLYAGPAARLARVKAVIHTRHGQRHGASARQNRVFRLACRSADRVVCVSDDSREKSRLEGVDPGSIRRIWNGIDTAKFRCTGPAADGPALFVGRLSPEKDVATLLRAAACVIQKQPSFRLQIAGDGSCKAELIALARELGLESHVVFLGSVSDVPALMNRASLFVLPSLTEGLPLTVLEAMSSGLPVVATRVGGTPEAVVDGETGELVEPRDVEQLAHAMMRLWMDRSRANQMGVAGRRRVENEFDARTMVSRYERLYRDVLRGASTQAVLPDVKRFMHRSILLPVFETVLKRRKTMRYWADLEAGQWLPRAAIDDIQFQALRRLIDHAYEHCAYYRRAWDEMGLRSRELRAPGDFQRWPIIDRDTIRAHRMEMRASNPSMPLITKATGGSSGVPLQFDLDHDSHDRRSAAWHRGYGWAGAEPGTKQLSLWGAAVGRVGPRSRLKDYLYNAMYRRLIMSCLSDGADLATRFAAEVDRRRPDAIIAYTNPLYEVARQLEAVGAVPRFHPRAIVVGAEKLHSFQRDLIERVFGAPIFETYGSREFMLIGAECERHCGLHITAEQLLVEVLDDDGRPTPEGAEGNVVITDLYNYGMPFVRYANGDRAIAGFSDCGCGRGLPLLKKVIGRRLDMIHASDGRVIPGEFFPHLVKDFPSVQRFQVVQEDVDRIRFSLAAQAMSDIERLQLERLVREAVGPGMQVDFEPVGHIPLTAAGKLQVVVNRVPHEKAC